MKRFGALALAAGTLLWLAGCQSTGSIGNLEGAPLGGAVRTAALHMASGRQVMPPYGYVAFCLRNSKECEGGTDTPKIAELTPARWSELNDVNNYVNRTVTQVEDIDNYGVAEYWAYPNARGGDCEDLALLKRKMLIERGWPAEDLLMTVVREWSGDGHAVLVVTTDKGDYVLDNKNWAIVAWSDAPYTWIKRQSPKRPYVWVSVDQSDLAVASNETLPPLGAPIPFVAAVEKARRAATAATAPLRPSLAEDNEKASPLATPMPTATIAAR